MRTFTLATIAAIVACWTAGCGGGDGPPPTNLKDVSGAKVTGRLLQSGKPVKILKEETIRVSFVSLDDQLVASSAEVKAEDGSFEVTGPTGKGLPPGKYKVGLSSDNYSGGTDRFADKFDSGASPFVAEVGPGEGQSFDVDIATGKVTKK